MLIRTDQPNPNRSPYEDEQVFGVESVVFKFQSVGPKILNPYIKPETQNQIDTPREMNGRSSGGTVRRYLAHKKQPLPRTLQ